MPTIGKANQDGPKKLIILFSWLCLTRPAKSKFMITWLTKFVRNRLSVVAPQKKTGSVHAIVNYGGLP